MSQLAGLLIFALAARVLPQNPAGAGQDVTGLVFLDANGNGTRTLGRGLAGIAGFQNPGRGLVTAPMTYHLDPSHGYGFVSSACPMATAVGASGGMFENSAAPHLSLAPR
jgi:hypothetical protein